MSRVERSRFRFRFGFLGDFRCVWFRVDSLFILGYAFLNSWLNIDLVNCTFMLVF